MAKTKSRIAEELRKIAEERAQRGDAWEPPANGEARPDRPRFPEPIPASQLRAGQHGQPIWQGYISRGEVTLLAALWKSGKTTLIAHLLKHLEHGGEFCGLELAPSRVLVVTEESEGRWAARRDQLSLQDNIHFIVRPFGAKSNWQDWAEFLRYVETIQQAARFDLLTFDPLVNLWPVRDENDASQVQSALMPIHKAMGPAAGLLVHHNRKGDGTEATAARGSGALTSWVDTIMELRRYSPGDRKDRRRVLTAYGRNDDTPEELVIELTEAGYQPCGDRLETALQDITTILYRILPNTEPGWTYEEIVSNWPEEKAARKQRILKALEEGEQLCRIVVTGDGVRGNPKRYWTYPPLVPQ